MYEQIRLCQAGDVEARDLLLRQYRPFVLKTTSKICGRFIDPQRDDEFSIAWMAFNESIDSYLLSRQTSFLAYAEKIIRNKLVDYFRKQKSQQMQVPFSTLADADEGFVEVQERLGAGQGIDAFAREQLAEARRLEIEEFQEMLREYQVEFADLVQLSPSHEDSRKMLLGIAQKLTREPTLLDRLLQSKKLPLNDLTAKLSVSRKTVERHRKYLIAVTLILTHAYPHLRSFLRIEELKEETT